MLSSSASPTPPAKVLRFASGVATPGAVAPGAVASGAVASGAAASGACQWLAAARQRLRSLCLPLCGAGLHPDSAWGQTFC